ncbi:MAG: DtxR family transcriptional regulator [Anaerolineae bacterium]|nr:DtxR family transcriptional regulator [Anaerolineae bacterium]
MTYNPLTALLIGTVLMLITAVILWPEKGILARWQKNRHLTERVQGEDALKHIYKFEMKGKQPTLESVAGILHISLDDTAELLSKMEANGLLTISADSIHLTTAGRETALHIIRAHRLYEHYLAEETGYDEAEWHGQAERFEHALSPDQIEDLATQLGNPTYDPHGDPIPTASGELVLHGGQPLTELTPGFAGRIVHLEDEPEIVYAQLAAEGLYPGMTVRVIEKTPSRIRFWANGDEHLLAPIVAANISIVEVATEQEETKEIIPNGSQRLSSLQPGETAEVIALSQKCRGAERRRFLDLGILPGTKITAEMRSPGGDPTAYIIRDALIALRSDQASLIQVKKQKTESKQVSA